MRTRKTKKRKGGCASNRRPREERKPRDPKTDMIEEVNPYESRRPIVEEPNFHF